MNVPLLAAVAVIVPIVVFLLLLVFERTTRWFAARHRISAAASIVFGALYSVFGVIETQRSAGWGPWLAVIVGAGFVVNGFIQWFRGGPQQLD